jgi:uncharacterized protein YecE (DUF72 family)
MEGYENEMKPRTRIGIAGWSIPASHREYFPLEGSHLERYAATFNCVEINSSFYRHHQAKTYRRWAETVPADFRFAVKLARVFTHDQALAGPHDEMREILEGISELGEKLGTLLVQLPPKLAFASREARAFFREIRAVLPNTGVAFEPRHRSWADAHAQALLSEFDIARVRADPERCFAEEYGSRGLEYFRLHGSPIIYRSAYEPDFIREIATGLEFARQNGREAWCIFDNTTFGHSIANGVELMALLDQREEFPVSTGLRFASSKKGTSVVRGGTP